MGNKTKVLVVDDSAVIRQVMADIISQDNSLELLAAVNDPILAMKRMDIEWPDVIVLDVEMPRMDGITFLKKIMSEHPTPVVMCSTLTVAGTETAMQALASGALDIITKPKVGTKKELLEMNQHILGVIRSAAKATNLKRLITSSKSNRKLLAGKISIDAVTARPVAAMNETTEGIVAIGTSTGGTQALEAVLTQLGRISPGIVVVQHMPEKFTAAFASRLDGLCEVKVKEAKDGDRVLPGTVLIAPGGKHMSMKRSGHIYKVEVKDGPPVNRHKPSVDVLFRSVAKFAGKNALGIIMTGMGDDGARGMKEMHDAGAQTIAQTESTCVVYGMPKEAVKLGATDKNVDLDKIPLEIIRFYDNKIVVRKTG